jgi:hypothetical protein
MKLVRIRNVEPLAPWKVWLELTDGSTVVRDLSALLQGPAFVGILREESAFRAVRAEGGTLVWPNGADLCSDVLIWGGIPPQTAP